MNMLLRIFLVCLVTVPASTNAFSECMPEEVRTDYVLIVNGSVEEAFYFVEAARPCGGGGLTPFAKGDVVDYPELTNAVVEDGVYRQVKSLGIYAMIPKINSEEIEESQIGDFRRVATDSDVYFDIKLSQRIEAYKIIVLRVLSVAVVLSIIFGVPYLLYRAGRSLGRRYEKVRFLMLGITFVLILGWLYVLWWLTMNLIVY